MDTTTPAQLTHRDVSVLRAIAAGRATLAERCGPVLTIDGFPCSDQFTARRLLKAGLIAGPIGDRTGEPVPARLTDHGLALLPAA